VRIARFAKGDGVAYGVVEGSDAALTIAELYGHPFGVDPGGVRLTGSRYPLAEVRLLAPVLCAQLLEHRNAAAQLLDRRDLDGPEAPALLGCRARHRDGTADERTRREHPDLRQRTGGRRRDRPVIPPVDDL